MAVNIANAQLRDGHDVSLLVINDRISDHLRNRLLPEVELIALRRPVGSHNPWHLLRLNRALRRIAPDVAHLHHVNVARYLRRRNLPRRWVTTHHTMWLPELDRFFADNPHLCAISADVAADIAAHTGLRATVVENGIDTAAFRRCTNNSDGNQFKIVQIGRIKTAVKGQDIALEALALVRRQGHNATLTLIGDGPDTAAMKALAQQLGISDCVSFTGPQPPEYIQQHLADFDLLIQPSRIEGFGLTIAEAMAARVPVAVAALPAPLDVIDHNRCGLSFAPESPKDLAAAITRAITSDTSDMVEAAGRRVTLRYDVAATARKYLEVYSKL